MNRIVCVATLVLTATALAGCTPGEPADPVSPEVHSSEQAPCIVGEWKLDVPYYAGQSEMYVNELGLHIVDFAMTGVGTIEFSAGGLVSTHIELKSSGTIVAGDTSVPFARESSYNGSGDWNDGEDLNSVDLANWANVPITTGTGDASAPPVPEIDYTNIPAVMALCSSKSLILQAPGAPLSAKWDR